MAGPVVRDACRHGCRAVDRAGIRGPACLRPLFDSTTKFDSGTGWASFFDHLPGVFGMKRDFQRLLPRTEYHCIRCDGHHGHVFSDGPKPTGLRYCNYDVALHFVPRGESLPAWCT